MSASTRSCRTRPRAIGEYAPTATPAARARARMRRWPRNGWYSTWLQTIGASPGGAHLGLVAVGGGGVDVAVADVERPPDRVATGALLQHPRAEPERWNRQPAAHLDDHHDRRSCKRRARGRSVRSAAPAGDGRGA